MRDIISPSGVNKTDKTQASPEFAHVSPFFMNVFFLTFPCGGESLHGFNLRRVRKSYLFPGTKQTVRDIVVSVKRSLTVCGILLRYLTSSDVSSGTNYTISSLTGDMDGANTDANVYITLYGEKGDSGFRKLDTKHFSRGK